MYVELDHVHTSNKGEKATTKNKQDFPFTKLKAFKVVQKRRLLGIFQMAKKTTATKMQ